MARVLARGASLACMVSACGGGEITPPVDAEDPDTVVESPDTIVGSIQMRPSRSIDIGMLGVSPVWVGAEALSEDGEIIYRSWLDHIRFSWSSSDPDVAALADTTCESSGGRCRLLTGVSEGTATVRATTQGMSDSITVTVEDRAYLAWSVPTGSGWASPDLAVGMDGTIYVGTSQPAVDQSIWSALSPQGDVLWTRALPLTYSMPAIGADGTLYFASRTLAKPMDAAGAVTAVDADGTVRWALEGLDGIRSSPAVGPDGTLYVAGGRHLHAVDPDGELLWSWARESRVFFLSSPGVANDGTVYVGAEDGLLHAINPDGSLRWTFETEDRIRSSPSIGVDGTIYFGSHDGRLYAVHPDGTERWSVPLHCGLPWGCEPVEWTPSIAADGTIYVFADAVYAIDSTGSVRWSYSDGAGTPILGPDGTVYLRGLSQGPGRDAIHALDAEGTLLWKYPVEELILGSPAIGIDGRIVWASSSGSSPASPEAVGTIHAIVENDSDGGYDEASWPTARGDRGNSGRAGG